MQDATQDTTSGILEAPDGSGPDLEASAGGYQEIRFPAGGGVRLTLAHPKSVQGVGGHLSTDARATGAAGYSPELFFSVGQANDLVFHLHTALDPADGSRHRYRVDLGPQQDLARVEIVVTAVRVLVAWTRSTRNRGQGTKPYSLRADIPIDVASGFFASSPYRLFLRRDGLLERQEGRGGRGYGDLETTTLDMDALGDGETDDDTYTGTSGNTGSGGGAAP